MISKETNVLQNEILKRMAPHQRLRIAFELNEFARLRIAAYLKSKNPEVSQEELSISIRERFKR